MPHIEDMQPGGQEGADHGPVNDLSAGQQAEGLGARQPDHRQQPQGRRAVYRNVNPAGQPDQDGGSQGRGAEAAQQLSDGLDPWGSARVGPGPVTPVTRYFAVQSPGSGQPEGNASGQEIRIQAGLGGDEGAHSQGSGGRGLTPPENRPVETHHPLYGRTNVPDGDDRVDLPFQDGDPVTFQRVISGPIRPPEEYYQAPGPVEDHADVPDPDQVPLAPADELFRRVNAERAAANPGRQAHESRWRLNLRGLRRGHSDDQAASGGQQAPYASRNAESSPVLAPRSPEPAGPSQADLASQQAESFPRSQMGDLIRAQVADVAAKVAQNLPVSTSELVVLREGYQIAKLADRRAAEEMPDLTVGQASEDALPAAGPQELPAVQNAEHNQERDVPDQLQGPQDTAIDQAAERPLPAESDVEPALPHSLRAYEDPDDPRTAQLETVARSNAGQQAADAQFIIAHELTNEARAAKKGELNEKDRAARDNQVRETNLKALGHIIAFAYEPLMVAADGLEQGIGLLDQSFRDSLGHAVGGLPFGDFLNTAVMLGPAAFLYTRYRIHQLRAPGREADILRTELADDRDATRRYVALLEDSQREAGLQAAALRAQMNRQQGPSESPRNNQNQ